MGNDNHSESSRLTWRSALMIALATAIVVGYLDVLLSSLFGRATFNSLYEWSAPVALTSLFFTILMLVALAVSAGFATIFKRDSLPMALSVSAAVLFGFCLFSVNNLFNLVLTSRQKWLGLFFLFLCLLFYEGFYHFIQTIAASGRLAFFNRSRIAFACVLVLFLGQMAFALSFFHDARFPVKVNGAFEAAPGPIKQVVIITVDTLRSDALSCYSKTAPPTPMIDRLAGDGILFSRAFAPTSWTLPSFASLWTGVSPAVHLANQEQSQVPLSLTTLAERFNEAGYLTAAIGTNPVMLNVNLDQGIRDYTWFPRGPFRHSFGGKLIKKLIPRIYPLDVDAAGITDLSRRWLAAHKDDAFFLWVHYLDPHHPYEPPRRFLNQEKFQASIGFRFAELHSARRGYFTPTPRQIAWIRELYDGEVKYVDDGIGQILRELKDLGLYDDALIALISDHGEEFWEHGGFEHGHTMFNELIWVPMILKLPQSSNQGRRIDRHVSIESVTPTLMDLCGFPFDRDGLSANSLVPLWDEGKDGWEELPIVSRANLYYEQQESVISGNHKLIRYLLSGREELYDLAVDFEEKKSMPGADRGDELQSLLQKDRLAATQLRQRYGIGAEGNAQMDPHRMEELRSLGYIQ